MTIFAISDLHLSFANPKPMDIFGDQWRDHAARIAENWNKIVQPEDIVLVAGDISWGMRISEAMPDLEFIAARPGRKIMIRGNHDYWWSRQATNRIQRMIDPSITLMQGTSLVIENVGLTGTRGWRLEDYGLDGPAQGDSRIYERELSYLRRGLSSLTSGISHRLVMLHYPPFDLNLKPNAFRAVLEEFDVDTVVYGHIHTSTGAYLEGNIDGINYHLVSVDHTGFAPVRII